MNVCKKFFSLLLCFGLLLGISQPAHAKTFADIQGHWGQVIIEDLAEKGVINGETPDIFNPEGAVTRVQFIKLLTCALTDSFPSGSADYSDIEADYWAKDYIVYARNMNILTDAAGSEFDPDREITRNVAAVWLGRAVGTSDKAEIPTFTDQADIQNFAEVVQAVQAGLMRGNEDGSFAPLASMTRAEAAAVISRVMALKTNEVSDSSPDSTAAPLPTPDTTPEQSAAPMEDIGVKPVHVAMGRDFTLMLKKDGTVWSSGSNRYGQLGYQTGYEKSFDKNTDINANFQQIKSLSNIKAVYATELTGFAIDASGTVWSWGSNNYGELGNAAPENSAQQTPTVVTRFTPQKIESLDAIVALSCGTDHVIALNKNGEVFTWGSNRDGQLGWGDQSAMKYKDDWSALRIRRQIHFAPFKVEELGSDVIAVSAEEYGNVALKENGDVWTWGAPAAWIYLQKDKNSYLANLNADESPYIYSAATPAQVSYENQYKNRLLNIRGVAAGRYHALALTRDGNVLAWGSHGNGQLGCGDNENIYENDYVQKVYCQPDASWKKMNGMTRELLGEVEQIEAGGDFAAALRSDGSVWVWGFSPIDITRRVQRVASTNDNPFNATYPCQVKDIDKVNELCIGYQECDNFNTYAQGRGDAEEYCGYRLMAVKEDGTVWNIDYPSKQVFDLN